MAPPDITAPIVHATTLITNSLITGRTGRAGLVTTTGFGDTLLIRDEHRYDMYDLQIEFPDPPIGRDRTFEIDERTSATGEVLAEPADADLDRLCSELAAARGGVGGGVPAQLLCEPGQRAGGGVAPAQGAGGCRCASLRRYRRRSASTPRMITAACNAATMPVIGPYLDELQKWLSAEGFGGSVLMMLSNGGVVSADDAARGPIRLVESGPAAGALAGKWYADRLGSGRLALLRHGRNHRQGLPGHRRRAGPHQHLRGGQDLPVQEGVRVPGVGAVGGSGRDRGGRGARWPGSTGSDC